MSAKRKPIIEQVVDRHFRPPNAARTARRQVFVTVGTALLVLAAMSADGWLSWLLWTWVGWRGATAVLMVLAGPALVEAVERRLAGLSASTRAYLTGTSA